MFIRTRNMTLLRPPRQTRPINEWYKVLLCVLRYCNRRGGHHRNRCSCSYCM